MSILRDSRLASGRKNRINIPDTVGSDVLHSIFELLSFLREEEDIRRKVGVDTRQHKKEPSLAWPKLVTAMPKAAYEAFLSSGVYYTFWQMDKGYVELYGWHTRYCPSYDYYRMSRKFSEDRLFGGPCEEALVYGVLLGTWLGGSTQDSHIVDYLNQYAADDECVLVEWDVECLNSCSFTVGDSQQNLVAVGPKTFSCAQEFTEFVYALGAVSDYFYTVHNKGGVIEGGDIYNRSQLLRHEDLVRALLVAFSYPLGRNPYIEFQMHKKVTPDDIVTVHTKEGLRA